MGTPGREARDHDPPETAHRPAPRRPDADLAAAAYARVLHGEFVFDDARVARRGTGPWATRRRSSARPFCLLATATWRRNAVWEGELVFWRDAVEKSPGKARPRQGLGTALVRSGDLAGGVAEFSAGLARVPPEASALRLALLHNLGNALIKLGRPAEAVEPLRRAVELDPNEVPPREGLALALWRTGDLDGAIREARGALDRKPDSAPAALVLGQALMARGDEAGAVRWLEQAVRASPGDPVVRYNLGAAYGNLGRVAEACATWRAVLLLPPAGNAHASAREGMAILACPP